ncbi:TetR/AcrR family transcriptional regulator [Hyphomicrobium sp.]|uniref:TetR/AcrR family transcriptional regulator n=1 Tax=Hyphomicrobium sp. TaxID=82 RepID=UPI002C23E2D6|nr:TetR/AcrR family transcriptional regulator [Hyphomicrobium sp.]HVZ03902.1 TetR/AcrR family transcriptional regulator [Hyphomicrobium sp.]
MKNDARTLTRPPSKVERPRKLQKRDVRQKEFLSAALRLFAERNYSSVTIKDIAQSLGLNAGLIYYYFDSKTDLLRASISHVVDTTFANFRELERDTRHPWKVIDTWLESNIKQSSDMYRFVKIAVDFKGANEHDSAIEAAICRFYDQERKLLCRAIRRGTELGVFRCSHPARMSDFISTHLDGCVVRSVVIGDFNIGMEIRELRNAVSEMLCFDETAGIRANKRKSRAAKGSEA